MAARTHRTVSFGVITTIHYFVAHPADLPTCRPADLPTSRPADQPTSRPADQR